MDNYEVKETASRVVKEIMYISISLHTKTSINRSILETIYEEEPENLNDIILEIDEDNNNIIVSEKSCCYTWIW